MTAVIHGNFSIILKKYFNAALFCFLLGLVAAGRVNFGIFTAVSLIVYIFFTVNISDTLGKYMNSFTIRGSYIETTKVFLGNVFSMTLILNFVSIIPCFNFFDKLVDYIFCLFFIRYNSLDLSDRILEIFNGNIFTAAVSFLFSIIMSLLTSTLGIFICFLKEECSR